MDVFESRGTRRLAEGKLAVKVIQLPTPCHLVVIMPLWTKDHRVFVYDTFVKSGESVIETQRCFRRHFRIGRHGEVPCRNTILRWVNAFRSKGPVMKTRPSGLTRTARTPQNVDRVRDAILFSQHQP